MTEEQRSFFEERAGILEFDGGLERSEAERHAREMTTRYFEVRAATLDSLMSGRARANRGKGRR